MLCLNSAMEKDVISNSEGSPVNNLGLPFCCVWLGLYLVNLCNSQRNNLPKTWGKRQQSVWILLLQGQSGEDAAQGESDFSSA